MGMGRQATIPVTQIRENSDALRVKVEKDSIDYLTLVQSIKDHGFQSVITVREETDADGNVTYPLVDGLHRFTAACEVGLTELPCLIVDIDSADVLAAQVMANANRIETQPAQYAAALKKVLQFKPTLTTEELGRQVGKSKAWVEGQLKLTKLNKEIQELVDNGQIGTSNAIALASLPPDRQGEYLAEAMAQPASVFGPKIVDVVKEIRAAARQARPEKIEFKAQPHVRKTTQIKEVLDETDASTIRSLLDSNNVTDPLEAAKLAVQWVLSLDPYSVQVQRAKWEAEQAEKKNKKEKAEAEKQAKKEKAAQEKAAAVLAS